MKIIIGTEAATYWRRIGALDNRMAYVLGCRELGHEVYLFDEVSPKRCLDKVYREVPFRAWRGREEFEKLAKAYGVWDNCCLLYDQGKETHGMTLARAIEIAESADLLLNISGRLTTSLILDRIKCKAYVDLAPGKVQVYADEYGIDRGFDSHDCFFTVGLNVGTPDSEIPSCGKNWQGICHPVVMSQWPLAVDEHWKNFTTISNWEGKHTFEYKGRLSGNKADNWKKFVELPQRTDQALEISLNIDQAYADDMRLFSDHGWILSDPRKLHTFDQFQAYIANSRAEFSVANQRCVEFNVGWTSERTARYLACGKPVLVQRNGIEQHLPVGKGLLTFATLDEAVAGIEAINRDYPEHCRAARKIAEAHFDSAVVLSKMLSQMGFGSAETPNRESAIESMDQVELSRIPDEEFLKSATERVLRNTLGTHVKIVTFCREPSKFATLFPADRLSLELADGRQWAVFVKYLGSEEVHHPEKLCRDREVQVYQQLLDLPELPVPDCYGSQWHAETERTLLFLEYIDDWNLKYQDMEYWFLAAGRLAQLHSEFASRTDVLRSANFLQQFDSNYFEGKARDALKVILRRDRGLAAKLDYIVTRYGQVAQLLGEAPVTLVHNDLSPKNVLVDRSESPARICFIDWEMAGSGCGLLDLVHLKYGLDSENDRRMIEAYCEQISDSRLLPNSQPDFQRLLAACELHRNMYLLASSPKWELPIDRLAEWVGEAERLWNLVQA